MGEGALGVDSGPKFAWSGSAIGKSILLWCLLWHLEREMVTPPWSTCNLFQDGPWEGHQSLKWWDQMAPPWSNSQKSVRKGAGCGGAHLPSQHSGGRGREISVSLRLAGSKDWVPGQPELHRETMSRKSQKKKLIKQAPSKLTCFLPPSISTLQLT